MTIKGSLQVSNPIVKAFLTRNFQSPVENWRKICVLRGKWGRNPCVKPRHLTYWSWKSVQGSWL